MKNDIEYYRKACQDFEYESDTGVFTKNKREVGTINSQGYKRLSVTVNGKVRVMAAHRVAWYMYYGYMPKDQIDHIDGDRSNNKISNLRECNNSQNQRNAKIGKNNTTGRVGVIRTKSGRYKAHIFLNKKIKWSPTVDSINEAIKIREAWEKDYYPDFCDPLKKISDPK